MKKSDKRGLASVVAMGLIVTAMWVQGDKNKQIRQETTTVPETTTEEQTTTEKQKTEESTETVGQQNAVRKALSYLRSQSFSKSGLADQLQYNGFTEDEAWYAVNVIDVDWTEQAKLKAQSYLRSSAFSRKELMEQLEYNGFTEDEAEAAVDFVGY